MIVFSVNHDVKLEIEMSSSDESNKKRALPKPHDRLFKRSMQERKIAIDLLRSKLPAALLAEIDLSTLTIVNNEHILDGLELLQSDCVCRCRIRGEEGYIFFNTEHQYRADEMMAFRWLRYAVGIMHNYTKNGHKKLPIVIGLVIYHGSKSPYPHSTEIWDCFEQPELAKRWALRPFHLIDLTVMSDKEIASYRTAAAMSMLFKYCREERLAWLKKMFTDGSLAIISSEIGRDYLLEIGRYVLKVCGSDKYPEDRYQALEILSQVDPEAGEGIVTFAEQFKQEGLQQGLRQGLLQGLEQGRQHKAFEIAKKMLAAGVDQRTIKNCTGLSDQEIARLRE